MPLSELLELHWSWTHGRILQRVCVFNIPCFLNTSRAWDGSSLYKPRTMSSDMTPPDSSNDPSLLPLREYSKKLPKDISLHRVIGDIMLNRPSLIENQAFPVVGKGLVSERKLHVLAPKLELTRLCRLYKFKVFQASDTPSRSSSRKMWKSLVRRVVAWILIAFDSIWGDSRPSKFDMSGLEAHFLQRLLSIHATSYHKTTDRA